jgi:hypothetical protein
VCWIGSKSIKLVFKELEQRPVGLESE